jgi:hypothetical protein
MERAPQDPVTGALRLLKMQLQLAMAQREEDPERAWLEAVSVRDKLERLVDGVKDEAALLPDVTRFRDKLEQQVQKLMSDVGDDVVAPLYSWIDLVRQRTRLDSEVRAAATRVAEARASRGASSVTPPARSDEAVAALAAAETDLDWLRRELPSPPGPEVVAVWAEEARGPLRAPASMDPRVVRARGLAGHAVVESVRGSVGVRPYAGSTRELVLVPGLGAAALLTSMFALSRTGPHAENTGLDALALLCCGCFVAAIIVSIHARRRARALRASAIDVAWHHAFFTEQSSILDLEVGWLRALAAALRAREAFDAHEGEGGQLAVLAKWRPDLEAVVAEVATTGVARSAGPGLPDGTL